MAILNEVLLVKGRSTTQSPIRLHCVDRGVDCATLHKAAVGLVAPEDCHGLRSDRVGPRNTTVASGWQLLVSSLPLRCQAVLNVDVLELVHTIGAH